MKDSITSDRFYRSKVVSIGGLLLGGDYPVRIQSMTNTDTMDTMATVDQCMRLSDAGAEMVRITAQGVREARHLEIIKNELRKRGYRVPIIADIHFQPKAAEVAAQIVEKVRLNPGNYLDRSTGSFSDQQYREELKKIASRMEPLLDICRKNNTVIRIGTNHGSLSQRIINRYGNTPLGMVESALEFARICSEQDFHNLVFSMKASDVRIMVYATRMLVEKMLSEGMYYPLHLGVTEAGNEWDGRIRSAAGIGALLADGIGDTIRVSLTEAPEKELPVARMIVKPFEYMRLLDPVKQAMKTDFTGRETIQTGFTGGDGKPVIISRDPGNIDNNIFPDIIDTGLNTLKLEAREYKLIDASRAYLPGDGKTPEFLLIDEANRESIDTNALKNIQNAILILESTDNKTREAFRHFNSFLKHHKINHPVILKIKNKEQHGESFFYFASAVLSASLMDGFGDGIWLDTTSEGDEKLILETSFSILQFLRLRIFKTEYIACPSCGRTLFNIEKVLSEVREKTSGLKGLKIAVMGCIVNGPGEMADADYGYVGSGPGKVTLYHKQQIVKKNIPEEKAIEALVELIKINGDWK